MNRIFDSTSVGASAISNGKPGVSRRSFLRALSAGGAALAGAGAAGMVVSAAEATAPAASAGMIATKHGADAELFRLARRVRAAWRATSDASKAAQVAIDRATAMKPPAPRPGPMPPEIHAELMSLSVNDHRAGRVSPRYAAYVKRADREEAEARAAWQSRCRAIDEECGAMAALDREADASWFANDLTDRLYQTRARTIDGMLLKIRMERTIEFGADHLARELAKDLRALQAAGVVLARAS